MPREEGAMVTVNVVVLAGALSDAPEREPNPPGGPGAPVPEEQGTCVVRRACRGLPLRLAREEGAMVTVNVVVLAGRSSDAAELKPMPSGDQVARFRLHVPETGRRVLPLPVSVWDKV